MTYSVLYSPLALTHLDFWRNSGQKSVVKKIARMLDELSVHPETGIGRPERLRGDLSGHWSRQINKKDRLVYYINGNEVTVEVISALGHYSDK